MAFACERPGPGYPESGLSPFYAVVFAWIGRRGRPLAPDGLLAAVR